MTNDEELEKKHIPTVCFFAAQTFFGAISGVVAYILQTEYLSDLEILLNAIAGAAIFCALGAFFWFLLPTIFEEKNLVENGKVKKYLVVIIIVVALLLGAIIAFLLSSNKKSTNYRCMICEKASSVECKGGDICAVPYGADYICPNCLARGIEDGSIQICIFCREAYDPDDMSEVGVCINCIDKLYQ